MTGQIEQRIDLGDGHPLGARRDPHDLTTGFDFALLNDAEVEVRCATSSAAICGSFMRTPTR